MTAVASPADHPGPGVRQAARRSSVVLVVPPFRSVLRPALGVSIIQANLSAAGIDSEILYLNLRFAERIGARLYENVGGHTVAAPGDFVFSCVRFARGRDAIVRYVDDVLVPALRGSPLLGAVPRRALIRALERLVVEAEIFVDAAVEDIVARRPAVVGFASSFQENLASLAIAERLKRRDPSITTVLGGANALAEMGRELFVQFDELDIVAQGECDLSFVELVRERLDGRAAGPIEGMLRREHPGERPPTPVRAEELEASPVPDFRDYLDQWRGLTHRDEYTPGLIMETSRGCWWGAKKPCAFCGCAGDQWAFRSKSDDRVLREIESLVERHGIHDIEMVDLILDNRRFRDLLPSLGRRPLASLFWETAGALSRRQVELLARAGVRRIQPGLESLSDGALRRMGKPTTRMRNLETLKWCSQAGIRIHWNYLCGLPGEGEEEGIDEVESLVPLISHLPPPTGAHLVRVQRFSRYCQDPDRYGLSTLRPAASYRHIYPCEGPALENLAYHFDGEALEKRADGPAYGRMRRMMTVWRHRHRFARLDIVRGRHGEWLLDSRRWPRMVVRRLSAAEVELLRACETGRARHEVVDALQATGRAAAETTLDALIGRGLIIADNGALLSLPLRRVVRSGQSWPWGGQLQPLRLGEAVRTLRCLRVSPLALLRVAVLVLPKAVAAGGRRVAGGVVGGLQWAVGVAVGVESD